jgi:hypothetical protein
VISCLTLLSPKAYTDMRSTREHLQPLKIVHVGSRVEAMFASGRTLQDATGEEEEFMILFSSGLLPHQRE